MILQKEMFGPMVEKSFVVYWAVKQFDVLKDDSFVHQGSIYLIKKYSKICTILK